MRSLIVGAIPVFALCLLSAESPKQKPPEDKPGTVEAIFEALFGRDITRSLRSGSVIGGNLIRADEWYVLSACEISAVRALLNKEERHVVTEGFPPQLPVAAYKLVLWGVADGNVVPLDLLRVDRSVIVLIPLDGKAGWYGVRDGKERECLRNLIKRIEDGKEVPVVRAQAGGTLRKRAE